MIELILSQGSNFEPIKGEIAQLQVGSADEIAVNANEFLHRMALCLFFRRTSNNLSQTQRCRYMSISQV